MQTQTTTTAKMPIKRDFVSLPPTIGDRITFNTPDDGVLAGFVSAFRSHLGNGEIFAWVELDQEWTGAFRGVPLRDIESADGFGGRHVQSVLCDFTSALLPNVTRGRES